MNKKPFCEMENCNLNELTSDVKEIKTALIGDEFNKNGLVQQVQGHDKRLSILEKAFYICFGGGTVIVFLTQIVISCK